MGKCAQFLDRARRVPEVEGVILRFFFAFLFLWAVPVALGQDEGAAEPAAEAPPETSDQMQLAEKISADQLSQAREGFEHRSRLIVEWVDALLDEHAPDWMLREIASGLSWGRVLLAILAFVVVGIFAWLFVRVVEKRTGHIRSDEHQTKLQLILAALRKPVALLALLAVGFHGTAMVVTPIAPDMLKALTIALYVGRAIAVLWLMFNLARAVEKRGLQWARSHERRTDELFVKFGGQVLRVAFLLITALLLLPLINLSTPLMILSRKLLGVATICAVTYLLIRAANLVSDTVMARHQIDVEDNYGARKVHTQVRVIRKIVVFIVVVLAMGALLMTFEAARQVGASILASAGIAGVVIGFAAQKTLGNLLAGIQIALTQPIRLEDVVIVEGEWGFIEEITLTYVVVRIWDLRRLVLPITYFVETPFENWTRDSSQIIGSIFLHTDYRVPMNELREKAKSLAEDHPDWDGQVFKLQVVDSLETTIKLRLIVSSPSSPRCWDLRCGLREGMLDWLRDNYPESLPHTRANLNFNPARPEQMAEATDE